jgi:hypothetical protein
LHCEEDVEPARPSHQIVSFGQGAIFVIFHCVFAPLQCNT